MTTTTAPAIGRHRIPRSELTRLQARFVIDHVLTRLGTADGLPEDDPAVPYADRTERLCLSNLAAWALGLTLTEGAEIAQCYECADIIDGALAEESTGIVRCDTCVHDRAATPPTHSYEPWADFYQS
ncbi:hypothetical protein ACUXZZ_45155 (plasmid) [Streptomyces graminifolii]|uniref:hypothetical protein n=1 Tax=Streptomyces graminifolii TaxID=1266771 RepID=UPI00405A2020